METDNFDGTQQEDLCPFKILLKAAKKPQFVKRDKKLRS